MVYVADGQELRPTDHWVTLKNMTLRNFFFFERKKGTEKINRKGKRRGGLKVCPQLSYFSLFFSCRLGVGVIFREDVAEYGFQKEENTRKNPDWNCRRILVACRKDFVSSKEKKMTTCYLFRPYCVKKFKDIFVLVKQYCLGVFLLKIHACLK